MGFNFGAFAGGAASGFTAGFEMAQKAKEREEKRKQAEDEILAKAAKERQKSIMDANKAAGDYMADREENLAIYNDKSASTKDRNIAYGKLKGSAAKLSQIASGYNLKEYPEIAKILETTTNDLKTFNSSMQMLKDYTAENGNTYVIPFNTNTKGATVDDAGNLRFKKINESGKFTNELEDIVIEPSVIEKQDVQIGYDEEGNEVPYKNKEEFGAALLRGEVRKTKPEKEKGFEARTLYRYNKKTGKQDSVTVKSESEYKRYSEQGFGEIKYDTSGSKDKKSTSVTPMESIDRKELMSKLGYDPAGSIGSVFGGWNEDKVTTFYHQIAKSIGTDGKLIGDNKAISVVKNLIDEDIGFDEIDVDKLSNVGIDESVIENIKDIYKLVDNDDFGGTETLDDGTVITYTKDDWNKLKEIRAKKKETESLSKEEIKELQQKSKRESAEAKLNRGQKRQYSKLKTDEEKDKFLKTFIKGY